jgi:hypothetical protein
MSIELAPAGPAADEDEGTDIESTREIPQFIRCRPCQVLHHPDDIVVLDNETPVCIDCPDCLTSRGLLEGPGGVVVEILG